MNNSLLKEEKYVDETKQVIDRVLRKNKNELLISPQTTWELLKYEIRKFTIKYSKSRAKERRLKYAQLEKGIREIEKIKDWDKDQSLLEKFDILKGELNEYSNYVTEGIILRSKCKWYEEGEKSTKYFLNLERRNKKKSCIRKVFSNNLEVTNQNKILKHISDFYGDLYSLKSDITEEECVNFLSKHVKNEPKLAPDESMKCDGYLTKDECFTALQKMGNSKSPGMDGLTKEFYCTFWDKIGSLLVHIFNESYDKGSLSTSQRQVVITLIEKNRKRFKVS
jgi:hypothetical protein